MLFQIIEENGVKKIKALTADTGAGAPVGSIIVVCSNILPSGYLGLGVQYDITNYPALYQVLGTDTTPTASALGLPTLSSGQYAIKATSGLTENQQENVLNTINENLSYSTEEHPTGRKWIDGKDIYSIVLVQNGQITTNTAYFATEIASLSIDTITFKFAKVKVISGGTVIRKNMTEYYANASDYFSVSASELSVITLFSGNLLSDLEVTLEYTKTTDN